MADLAVVIVTWNVRDLVLNALQSLYADLEQSALTATVYVVDSASHDGTPQAVADAFPKVKLIASHENLGFGRANNLAMRQMGFGQGDSSHTPPEVVYLLNPDTITQLGATRALYDALRSQPDAGMVGAQLAYEDGHFQHSAFRFPGLRQLWVELFPTPPRLYDSPFNGRYPQALYQAGVPFKVDFTLGATMMLRREVIEQTGMFDEQFFMYCEEIDWAWRIYKAGWHIYCVPTARVIHLSGQSTGQARPQSFINLWTSRLRLYKKHHPSWKARVARWMVALGMRRRARQLGDVPAEQRAAMHKAYQTIEHLALSSE